MASIDHSEIINDLFDQLNFHSVEKFEKFELSTNNSISPNFFSAYNYISCQLSIYLNNTGEVVSTLDQVASCISRIRLFTIIFLILDF